MPYNVPQFIDIEDKIFGPLSLKQFLYLVGGVGLSYLIWISLPAFFAIVFIIPIMGFAVALAFYKVNNQPFLNVVGNAIRYFFSTRLYIWRKEEPTPEQKKKKTGMVSEAFPLVPKLSESKLKDLAWGLDVHQSLYAEADGVEKAKQEKVFRKDTSEKMI